MGTGALNVAVGQEPVGIEVEVLLARPPVDVSVLEKPQEDVVGHLGMVLCIGGGVEVPADTETVPVAHELSVVAVDYVGRGYPLGVGTNRYGGSVHI